MKNTSIILLLVLLAAACSNSRIPVDEVAKPLDSNPLGKGQSIEVEFLRGEGHNHPLMAIWVEDTSGTYVQTLYVAESIAKGVFRHGDSSEGFWKPGEIQRPAALPRWVHQRGIKNEQGGLMPTPTMPVLDAYTGPTPPISFLLSSRLDILASGPFRVLLEINQTWDWNQYWNNNRYPEDEEYKTSCQPAVIYAATLDPAKPGKDVEMKLLGRSHHSGADGKIYTDLETLTTALHIAESIVVRIPE